MAGKPEKSLSVLDILKDSHKFVFTNIFGILRLAWMPLLIGVLPFMIAGLYKTSFGISLSRFNGFGWYGDHFDVLRWMLCVLCPFIAIAIFAPSVMRMLIMEKRAPRGVFNFRFKRREVRFARENVNLCIFIAIIAGVLIGIPRFALFISCNGQPTCDQTASLNVAIQCVTIIFIMIVTWMIAARVLSWPHLAVTGAWKPARLTRLMSGHQLRFIFAMGVSLALPTTLLVLVKWKSVVSLFLVVVFYGKGSVYGFSVYGAMLLVTLLLLTYWVAIFCAVIASFYKRLVADMHIPSPAQAERARLMKIEGASTA